MQTKNTFFYTFKLDLKLLNLLRDFKHENHIYEKHFVETILACL